jgi:hypothetical protein
MAAEQNGDRRDDGFELYGTFYPWHVSTIGKDLMLIDKFSGLPVSDFFEIVDDEHERGRAPILLTLVATSIRNGRPDWSVERITRTVMDLSLDEVVFVNTDAEEAEPGPPASEAVTRTGRKSSSPSKSPASEAAPEPSATSNETPA